MATKTSTERLGELLGTYKIESDVLTSAIKEIKDEQAEARKEQAKELVRKALELQGRMNAAEKQFKQEKARFDKELGKTLNRLNNFAAGKDDVDEDEEGADAGKAAE